MTAPGRSILSRPSDDDFLPWPRSAGRRFMLFVDTEEEFDWLAPFDRAATRVSATRGLAEGQRYFATAGVRPVYLTDYPVIEDPAASALLAQWAADGQADVGAHLHPWVTPPHEEEVSIRNSFAGNLPPALERAKLRHLGDRIEARIGRRPIAYRAGRYGVGAETATMLREEGYRLDCSIRSRFDYSADHGPDFSGLPIAPYWLDAERSLLELPLSTAYVGHLRGLGDNLHDIARRHPNVGAGLSCLNLFTRIPLTPEGVRADHCIAAIDALIECDMPVLSFSFHSPTLEPGNTPYTPRTQDVADFYHWWDAVLNHLARRGVQPMGLDDLLDTASGTHVTGRRAA